jgi:radical SAM protein with 4Fe4S-binding SPASM domain
MYSPAKTNKLLTVLKRFLFNPMVLVNYIGALAASRSKPNVTPFQPVSLDMEPTGRCNFRCKFCQVPTMQNPAPDLTLEKFRDIIAQFPHVLRVKVQGMGEPLMNRELFDIISYLKRRNIYTYFTTNASLLTEASSQRAIGSGVDEIYVSLDGASADTFESIRAGGSFGQVTANIRRLASMRSGKLPLIKAWTVCTRTNQGELPDIVRLAGELGLDGIVLQQDINFWGKQEYADKYRDEALSPVDIERSIGLARALAGELGIEFSLYESDSYSAESPCQWPWRSTYISSDGHVIPCCVRADPSILNFGNILETPFKQIWNGAEYRELRKSIRDNRILDYCRDCYQRGQR